VPTAWEDWPLGITSGRYDVALVNIAVTEQRKEKFDLPPTALTLWPFR
jgi:polar amino acid transport system substrate-binding protein